VNRAFGRVVLVSRSKSADQRRIVIQHLPGLQYLICLPARLVSRKRLVETRCLILKPLGSSVEAWFVTRQRGDPLGDPLECLLFSCFLSSRSQQGNPLATGSRASIPLCSMSLSLRETTSRNLGATGPILPTKQMTRLYGDAADVTERAVHSPASEIMRLIDPELTKPAASKDWPCPASKDWHASQID
jgi:hypothetical protein